MTHLAFYGSVRLLRTFCAECARPTLVIKGIKQCCNRPDNEEVDGTERIGETEHLHTKPSARVRRRILTRQGDGCLYCDRRFGSSVWYKGRLITLRINWDHVLPYNYAQENLADNFVAACHVCNKWKSSMVFNTLEEIQIYVAEKWERVGTDVGKNLHGMRDAVSE